jgi:Mn-dependent DtxR family transcriptional regulator
MNPADDSDRDGPEALAHLRWRDEILQLLYWLQGEGLMADVAADDLRRFLEGDPGSLAERLERLVREGYVELAPGDPCRYRLTAWGTAEGRRRFLDEFAPFLGRDSHRQCGDTGCECHTSGEACSRLQRRAEPS